MKLETKQFN